MINSYRKYWVVDEKGFVVSVEGNITKAKLDASHRKFETGKEFFVWGMSLVDATQRPFPTKDEAVYPRVKQS